MFTGLIEHVVPVKNFLRKDVIWQLDIVSPYPAEEIALGESIAINGVCLTVSAIKSGVLSFDIQKETIDRTYFADLRPGYNLNIERALSFGDRLGGHLVQGHVDEIGVIKRNDRAGQDWVLSVAVSSLFSRQVIPKGSVAVDGISLTVVSVKDSEFTVHIIPHSLTQTNLLGKKQNDPVNLESDVIGKYVYNYFARTVKNDSSLNDALRRNGFI
jgi:riboflavin synthase